MGKSTHLVLGAFRETLIGANTSFALLGLLAYWFIGDFLLTFATGSTSVFYSYTIININDFYD